MAYRVTVIIIKSIKKSCSVWHEAVLAPTIKHAHPIVLGAHEVLAIVYQGVYLVGLSSLVHFKVQGRAMLR